MSELYEKSLGKLELDQVLQLLAECAGSEGGKEACLSLRPSSDLEEVELLTKEGKYIHLEVEHVRYFKNLVIVKFKSYDNINDIEQYKKCNLYVTRENAVELEEDEYFVADLIGLTAKSDEGEELGTLTDVLTTGANDVYVIQGADGEELLVPAIHDCVQEVNVEGGYVILHLIPGLRDLNK